jgi:hypothetical protein
MSRRNDVRFYELNSLRWLMDCRVTALSRRPGNDRGEG